jgi:hypothetical protein
MYPSVGDVSEVVGWQLSGASAQRLSWGSTIKYCLIYEIRLTVNLNLASTSLKVGRPGVYVGQWMDQGEGCAALDNT